jgi:hypothetical protein
MAKPNNSQNLEDILSNSNAIVVSDSVNPLTSEAFQYANDYKLPIVYTGGAIMHEFVDVAKQLGYTLPEERMFNYFAQKLHGQDLEALQIRTGIESYGLENFVNLIANQYGISQDKMPDFIKYVQDMIQYSEKQEFKDKLGQLEKQFENSPEADEFLEDKLRTEILYSVVMNKNAKLQADKFNEHKGVEGYIVSGDRNFLEMIQQYMDNPEQLKFVETQEELKQIAGLDEKLLNNPMAAILNETYALTQNQDGQVTYNQIGDVSNSKALAKYDINSLKQEVEQLVDMYKQQIDNHYKKAS